MKDLLEVSNTILDKISRKEPLNEGELLFIRGIVEQFVRAVGNVQWVSKSLELDLGATFWNRRS